LLDSLLELVCAQDRRSDSLALPGDAKASGRWAAAGPAGRDLASLSLDTDGSHEETSPSCQNLKDPGDINGFQYRTKRKATRPHPPKGR
jgi:hypothetical protein